MFFIKILYFVQVQQHAAGSKKRVQLVYNALDIRDSGSGGVQFAEAAVGLFGNDAGNRGFSGTGGPVKDHIGDLAAFDYAAQHSFPAQNMPLANNILKALGSYFICKWLIHNAPPLSGVFFMDYITG